MPPKGRAKSGGSKLGWESELVQAELNDSEWNCHVHFILGTGVEANGEVTEKLSKAIGHRERFSIITPEHLLETIQDKKTRPTSAKFSEVYDVCKHIDHGGDITEIYDLGPVVLARLVKFYLLRQRETDMQRIQAKLEKNSGSKSNAAIKTDKKAKDNGKGKRSTSAKKKKGKGKTPVVEDDVKKDWSDLKKRGEVDEEEEKDIFIDDEPDDGPIHYVLLSGFTDPNILSLLAEQGVEIMSVIQIKKENHEELEKFPFWSDLCTVFKRGLKRKQLIHCTRWQLTAFNSDLEGIQLFDEVAVLCYDLQDQKKAYDDFTSSLQIISTPSVLGMDEEVKPINSRYESFFDKIPLVGQSVNLICYALRETVVHVVDEVKEEKDENTQNKINQILSSALSGLDIDPDQRLEIPDLSFRQKEMKDDNSHLYYKNDSSSLRLAGLSSQKRTELEQIEEEMISLYPVNELFRPRECEFSGKLAEIDYQLQSRGSFSESQVRRILLQLSAEALPLDTVGSTGQIEPNDAEPKVPWDNANQLVDLIDTDLVNNVNLNMYSIYERFNHSSAIQVLADSIRESSACTVMKLARDHGTLLATYNPVGSGVNLNQNVQSWQTKSLTHCGFRQWIEHFQSDLTDWLQQWEIERKQKEEDAKICASQEKDPSVKSDTVLDMERNEQIANENIFIMPDSLKKQDMEKHSASETTVSKKKSSRKSLKGSAKSSRTSSKTKLRPKSSRSSSRVSNKKETVKDNSMEVKSERPVTAPLYKAYELGPDLLFASGNERKIFTSDGGKIRIKQVGFINQGDNLSIIIENDDSVVQIYQATPREVIPKPEEKPIEKEVEEERDEDKDEVKSVVSSVTTDRLESWDIPSATFSSVFCSFSDGIKASFSMNGPLGKPRNWEAESVIEDRKFGHKLCAVSPTPSRDTTPSVKAKNNSKKGGKKPSEISVTSDQSTPDEEKADEEVLVAFQQVYISTPDGLNIRFGKCPDNKLMVKISKPNLKEDVRVITHDSILRVYGDGHECYNFATGEISGLQNGENFIISPSGERNDGENYLYYTGTDPITKNTIMVRSDGYIQVDRHSCVVREFPDGSRVTKSEDATRIENPLYPLVLFEEDYEKCLVILSNGSVIQIESNGSYHITSSSGGSFAVGQDGTVLFTAKQDYSSTYIIRQTSNAILEVIEPDGMTTIQISNTGGTSILKSIGENEEENETQNPELFNSYRYFYLSESREAFEFFKQEEGMKIFEDIEKDNECAVLKQNIPEAPHEQSATLICPFKVNNNWAIEEYTEENIIPAYLQQADLKCTAHKLSKPPTESPKFESGRFEKTILTQRNFVIGVEVTDEMKKTIREILLELSKQEKERLEKNEESHDLRENDQFNTERSKLLSRFLALAAEQDVETLRQKWMDATAPAVCPPPEKARPKLTQKDWERIKNEKDKTRQNLISLKKRTVPNYWDSQKGKDFLASGGSNEAKEAEKNLPKQQVCPVTEFVAEEVAEDIVLTAIKTGHNIVHNPEAGDQPNSQKDRTPCVRSMVKNIMPNSKPSHPHHRLQFNPEVANFGILEEDQNYLMRIELKNTGMFTVRFKMVPCNGVKLKYKMGPIPAGMSTMVDLEMLATGGVLREDGLFDVVHTLVMVNQNKETTELPIIARLMPQSEIVKREMLNKPTLWLNKHVKKLKTAF